MKELRSGGCRIATSDSKLVSFSSTLDQYMPIRKTTIRYCETAPEHGLRKHILDYWEFEVTSLGPEPYQHHVPPDGCVSIAVNYREDGSGPIVLFVGPRTETFEVAISSRDHYFGIRFWPHSSSAVLGLDLPKCHGQVAPAICFAPQITQQLTASLPNTPERREVNSVFNDILAGYVENADELDSVIERAVSKIVRTFGACSMAELAAELKISSRQLQRRFRSATGLTPKQFARLRRFRHAASELLREQPRSWATVAYDAGYADQSHLAREFSQLIGLTAEELREKHTVIEHGNVNP